MFRKVFLCQRTNLGIPTVKHTKSKDKAAIFVVMHIKCGPNNGMNHDLLNRIIHQSGDTEDVIVGRCNLIFGGCLKFVSFLFALPKVNWEEKKLTRDSLSIPFGTN